MNLVVTPKVRSVETFGDGSVEVTVDFHYAIAGQEEKDSGVHTKVITLPPIPDVKVTSDPRVQHRTRDLRQTGPM